ncbi:class I histocompatibility antigen, F10 alpha chain-like, partial [Empidonax traillii]|uniref:class I histocompatibility antigen, F10 alpha chain-like n=1 Tax=Empidonax traillii TaxID=164674 RepID=UPI000FFCFF2E
LHTLQWVCGCDLLSDGSIHGSYRHGYDGRDFISFELGSRSFVAADGAAQITKRKWEHDGIVVERRTHYLGSICPEALRKFIGYGREVLERKEPPDVHVSGYEEHGILTLSCHAYGFYPRIIGISWMKGDEIWDQETEWGGIVPNSDGTFHSWARIEALPGEREQYRCRVEHAGMPEPGIFAWEPESVWNSTPVLVAVSVIAAIIVIIGLIAVGVWKLRAGNSRDGGREGPPDPTFLYTEDLQDPHSQKSWISRSFLHSLRYLQVAVTEPSPGVPQFMALEYLDGIPISCYDSERGQVEPLTPWMAAGPELGYWDEETQ